MAEMTPLERAANAIEHEFIELADPYGNVSAYGMAHRVARAVLTAIREPSSQMAEAGSAFTEGDYAPEYVGNAQKCWAAMIDAALAEEG